MEDYKLSIANIIWDYVRNLFKNQRVTNYMFDSQILTTLSDLDLEEEEWHEAIQQSLDGKRSSIPTHLALSRYGYEKASKINSNPTFSQVWVEINDFTEYCNVLLSNDLYLELESAVDDLTKDSIKKEYSWDKRIVARFIVKKGYENALKISDNPNDDLIKKSTFDILYSMYGFNNVGLLFAVRDLLADKFYNEEKFGEALSKIAFEDLIRMGNPEKSIDFDMWVGRKGLILQKMNLLDDEEVKMNLIESNNINLFLDYLLSFYDVEDSVHNEFIVDLGNRHYGASIDQEFLLKVIYGTAEYEASNEIDFGFDFKSMLEIESLKNEKIEEMLKYLGWEDDLNAKSIIQKIDKEYKEKALEHVLSNSSSSVSDLFKEYRIIDF